MVRVSLSSFAFGPTTKAPSRLIIQGPRLLLFLVIHAYFWEMCRSYMEGFRNYFNDKKEYLKTQVGNPEGADKPVSYVITRELRLDSD